MEDELRTPKHEFRVTIGTELPAEVVKRIAQSIQKSVLAELADADLRGPLAINFLGEEQNTVRGGNGGETQGIQIFAQR